MVQRVCRALTEVVAWLGGPKNAIPVPDEHDLSEILTAAYWASMVPDEQRFLRPSLLYANLYATNDQVTLKRPVTLTPQTLAKLAPAQPQGSHFWLAKGPSEELQIFAITQTPPAGVLVRVVGPEI